MSSIARKFIFKIIVLTLFVSGIASLLFSSVLQAYQFKAFPYQILLIAFATTVGHLLVVRASKLNTLKFSNAFMISVTLKLFIYILFMLIYLWIDHSQVVIFGITFLLLYLSYTIFEVAEILKYVKKSNNTPLKN